MGDGEEITNNHLCLPADYNKFDLPYRDRTNMIDIGIDITDVLRINDKEYSVEFSSYFSCGLNQDCIFLTDFCMSSTKAITQLVR